MDILSQHMFNFIDNVRNISFDKLQIFLLTRGVNSHRNIYFDIIDILNKNKIFCFIFGFASTIYEILLHFVRSYMGNDLPYGNMRMRILPQGSLNSLTVLSWKLDPQ